MNKNNFLSILLSFMTALLCACGGSSSDSSSPASTQSYTITGTISGGSGATVNLTGPVSKSTITDASGNYSITGLSAGQYTVTPVQEDFYFVPESTQITVTNNNANAQSIERKQAEEGLSSEILDRIDKLPDNWSSQDQIILPNGQSMTDYAKARGLVYTSQSSVTSTSGALAKAQANPLPPATGPEQKKNDVIWAMVAAAQDFACARMPNPCTKWDHPADPADPTNEPAQTGLTYIWGGKDPYDRTKPTDGCLQKTFGVDCSGLISNIATRSGMSVTDGSASQAIPSNWSIPSDWQLQMKLVTDGSIESGDIVAWSGHVGIIDSNGNVISSTGGSGRCKANITPPHGPRSLSISALGLGKPTAVLRLVTTLSGDWTTYLRCTTQNTDAVTINFHIDNDKGGPFTANGSGVDYDGTPLSYVMTGNYDQTSNIVTATLAFTNGTRSDSFSEKLLQDDTGYFPLTKVVNNGGCDASARLVRVQPATSKAAQPQPSTKKQGIPASQLLHGLSKP